VNGNYHGIVVATHRNLALPDPRTDAQVILPGVTVRVYRWEGCDYTGAPGTAWAPFQIDSHDRDVVRP